MTARLLRIILRLSLSTLYVLCIFFFFCINSFYIDFFYLSFQIWCLFSYFFLIDRLLRPLLRLSLSSEGILLLSESLNYLLCLLLLRLMFPSHHLFYGDLLHIFLRLSWVFSILFSVDRCHRTVFFSVFIYSSVLNLSILIFFNCYSRSSICFHLYFSHRSFSLTYSSVIVVIITPSFSVYLFLHLY